jgi:hypothetical protein
MADEFLMPAKIDPDGIYTEGQARLLLGLTAATFARARRQRRVRFTRQGQRLLYRGTWLIEWLESSADRDSIK